MNAWRIPYEAHMSVVGYASEGSALRSMWRSHASVPKRLPARSRFGEGRHFGVQALNLAWYRAGTGFSPWELHKSPLGFQGTL